MALPRFMWVLKRVKYEGEVVLRGGDEIILGRNKACSVPICSIVVSKRHCILKAWDDNLSVTDLNSSNGTFVNGNRIPREVEVRLRSGNTLSLGVQCVNQEDEFAYKVTRLKEEEDLEQESELNGLDLTGAEEENFRGAKREEEEEEEEGLEEEEEEGEEEQIDLKQSRQVNGQVIKQVVQSPAVEYFDERNVSVHEDEEEEEDEDEEEGGGGQETRKGEEEKRELKKGEQVTKKRVLSSETDDSDESGSDVVKKKRRKKVQIRESDDSSSDESFANMKDRYLLSLERKIKGENRKSTEVMEKKQNQWRNGCSGKQQAHKTSPVGRGNNKIEKPLANGVSTLQPVVLLRRISNEFLLKNFLDDINRILGSHSQQTINKHDRFSCTSKVQNSEAGKKVRGEAEKTKRVQADSRWKKSESLPGKGEKNTRPSRSTRISSQNEPDSSSSDSDITSLNASAKPPLVASESIRFVPPRTAARETSSTQQATKNQERVSHKSTVRNSEMGKKVREKTEKNSGVQADSRSKKSESLTGKGGRNTHPSRSIRISSQNEPHSSSSDSDITSLNTRASAKPPLVASESIRFVPPRTAARETSSTQQATKNQDRVLHNSTVRNSEMGKKVREKTEKNRGVQADSRSKKSESLTGKGGRNTCPPRSTRISSQNEPDSSSSDSDITSLNTRPSAKPPLVASESIRFVPPRTAARETSSTQQATKNQDRVLHNSTVRNSEMGKKVREKTEKNRGVQADSRSKKSESLTGKGGRNTHPSRSIRISSQNEPDSSSSDSDITSLNTRPSAKPPLVASESIRFVPPRTAARETSSTQQATKNQDRVLCSSTVRNSEMGKKVKEKTEKNRGVQADSRSKKSESLTGKGGRNTCPSRSTRISSQNEPDSSSSDSDITSLNTRPSAKPPLVASESIRFVSPKTANSLPLSTNSATVSTSTLKVLTPVELNARSRSPLPALIPLPPPRLPPPRLPPPHLPPPLRLPPPPHLPPPHIPPPSPCRLPPAPPRIPPSPAHGTSSPSQVLALATVAEAPHAPCPNSVRTCHVHPPSYSPYHFYYQPYYWPPLAPNYSYPCVVADDSPLHIAPAKPSESIPSPSLLIAVGSVPPPPPDMCYLPPGETTVSFAPPVVANKYSMPAAERTVSSTHSMPAAETTVSFAPPVVSNTHSMPAAERTVNSTYSKPAAERTVNSTHSMPAVERTGTSTYSMPAAERTISFASPVVSNTHSMPAAERTVNSSHSMPAAERTVNSSHSMPAAERTVNSSHSMPAAERRVSFVSPVVSNTHSMPAAERTVNSTHSMPAAERTVNSTHSMPAAERTVNSSHSMPAAERTVNSSHSMPAAERRVSFVSPVVSNIHYISAAERAVTSTCSVSPIRPAVANTCSAEERRVTISSSSRNASSDNSISDASAPVRVPVQRKRQSLLCDPLPMRPKHSRLNSRQAPLPQGSSGVLDVNSLKQQRKEKLKRLAVEREKKPPAEKARSKVGSSVKMTSKSRSDRLLEAMMPPPRRVADAPFQPSAPLPPPLETSKEAADSTRAARLRKL